MTIPVVTRLEDWRFALYDLATVGKTVLNPDLVLDPQTEVVPGVGAERLKSCTFEIPFLATARSAFDFDAPQVLAIDRWGDSSLTLWGLLQKPKEGYSNRVKKDSVQATVASIEELLKARKVYEIVLGEPAAISAHAYPDDFAKELVRRCFSGLDYDGNSRAWEWGTLNVEADSSQCAAEVDLIALSGSDPNDNLYKYLDDLARAYDFDFQLAVTIVGGAWVFTFKTKSPYGGSDLTTGASRVIVKDLYNQIPNATRYRDAMYRATRMFARGYKLSVDDAAALATWGLWEGVADGPQESDAEIALEKARVKEGAEYGYEATAANGKMALWCEHFKAGDLVNRVNNRLGIAADTEKIAAVTARFENKVMAVTIRWGDREPGMTDRQSGGPYYPDYEYGDVLKDPMPVGNTADPGDDPTHLLYGNHVHPLNLTTDDGKVMVLTAGVGNVLGSGGIATSIVDGDLIIDGSGVVDPHELLSQVHTDTAAASVVRGDLIVGQGASPDTLWTRLAIGAAYTFPMSDGTDLAYHAAVIAVAGDVGDGATPDAVGAVTFGGSAGYSFNAHDNQVDFTGPWTRDDGNGYLYPTTLTDHVLVGRNDQVGAHGLGTTYLDVGGDVRVDKYLYATANGLTLYGASGIVDIYNNSSACTLNIYNGAAKNIMLDSNGSSYFRGGGVHIEHSHSLTLYSDDGTTTTASWAATDGAITIEGGGDITVQASGDTKFFVDGATGDTTWKAAATLTLEGVAYRAPTSAPGGSNYILTVTTGSPNQLVWSAAANAAAHNLLSATHGDTLADSVIAGDMIIGNATPKWARLAKGSQYDMLVMGAALPAWSAISNLAGAGLTAATGVLAVGAGDGITVNANDVALTTPGTLTVSTTNSAAGSHTHAITTTSTGTASRILALDASGYTRVTRLEVYDDTGYIWRSEANAIQMRAASYAGLKAGDSAYVWLSATDFYPVPTATINNGKSDRRWATYYGVNGDLTGTLDVDGAVTFGSTLQVTGQITSLVATGSAPLVVASTTKVTNLNADYLDGYSSSMAADVNTVAVRNASGNLYANAYYDGVYYCKPNGSSSFNGNLNLNGEIQADSIRIDITPTVKSAGAYSRAIPINCNGTTRYMMLADAI